MDYDPLALMEEIFVAQMVAELQAAAAAPIVAPYEPPPVDAFDPENDDVYPYAPADEEEYLDIAKNTINLVLEQFKETLATTDPRTAVHKFQHPGLNCTYGVEMEFCASATRYDLANRVNSCMFNLNDLWWRRNFNLLTVDAANPFDPDLPGDGRHLQANAGFDQWSGFFVEPVAQYKYSPHRGDERCLNRGNAGQKIENDVSVTLEPHGPGVTLWSAKKSDQHNGTDLRLDDAWAPNVAGLEMYGSTSVYDTLCNWESHHTSPGKSGSGGVGIEGEDIFVADPPAYDAHRKLKLFDENEYVSSVLANWYVNYPCGKSAAAAVIPRALPLGSLLLDNLFYHMRGHSMVLATQRSGFHIHLSEFPRIVDPVERKWFLVGFVKLFYLFEPLLYSFHPYYRSASTYCQSIQSLFNLHEIRGPVDPIWEDLVHGIPIGGPIPDGRTDDDGNLLNRRARGTRYVSLNFTNCVAGGIGTVEVRLGHCSFSSTYVQAFINFLQNLMMLNKSMFYNPPEGEDNLFIHNYFLSTYADAMNLIPDFCRQSIAKYNLPAPPIAGPISAFNAGRPEYGYFVHTNATPENKTALLVRLAQLFHGLTNASEILEKLCPYINYYHTNNDSWIQRDSIPSMNIRTALRNMNLFLDRDTLADGVTPADRFNAYDSVVLGKDYYLNDAGKSNVIHACRTCSKNLIGSCKELFNDGNNLDKGFYALNPLGPGHPNIAVNWVKRTDLAEGELEARIDESRLYYLQCNGRREQGKIQTETINYKISPYKLVGGARKRRGTRVRRMRGGANKTKKNRGNSNKLNTHTYIDDEDTIVMKKYTDVPVKNPDMYKVQVVNTAALYKEAMARPVDLKSKAAVSRAYAIKYGEKLNKGNDPVEYEIATDGSVRVFDVDWLGGRRPRTGLSNILTNLVKRKIVDYPTLDKLIERRYVDGWMYTTPTPLHKAKLVKELGTLCISATTVEKMMNIYKETAST